MDWAVDPQSIPVIDLQQAREAGPSARAAVVQSLDQAARDIGFFTVTGSGIPKHVTANAYAALSRFMALPLAEKRACRLEGGPTPPDDPYTPYGYSALLEENAFAYMGREGLPSDYVEKFSLGRLALDDRRALPFPPGAFGSEMRAALVDYFRHATALAEFIARLIEEGLALPRGSYTDRMARSADSMRCHAYPARLPEHANDQGMGAHQDGSLITLLSHTGPGIEVQARSGGWLRPSAGSPDDVLVNIGDLLSRWTDGRYVSTPHRVVLTERNRLSIAFFKLTDEDSFTEAGDRQMNALFGR